MNNNTNNSDELLTCHFPSLTVGQQAARAGSIIVVMVLSFVGNILVVHIIRSNIKLHSVTHYLIVNLACADLLITIVNMPVLFKMEVTGDDKAFDGVAGQFYCVGLIAVLNVSVACSIFTLTAIAVERFCSIMFPYKKIITLKFAKVIMFCIWIFSFVTTIPFFFHIKVEDYYGDGVFYCVEDWSPLDTTVSNQVFQIAFFILLYACPLTVISVLYFSIAVKLWRRQAKTQTSSFGHSHSRRRMTIQVTKMLIVSVVVFALCWLPQHVALFINYFMLHMCPPEFLWFGGTLLAYANSAINPIIYVTFNSEYRKHFKATLSKCWLACTRLQCKGRTPNRLNLNAKTKAEISEEFVLVNLFSIETRLTDGSTEVKFVNCNREGTKSEENHAFNKHDETPLSIKRLDLNTYTKQDGDILKT